MLGLTAGLELTLGIGLELTLDEGLAETTAEGLGEAGRGDMHKTLSEWNVHETTSPTVVTSAGLLAFHASQV